MDGSGASPDPHRHADGDGADEPGPASQTAFLAARSQWTEEELAALAEIGAVLSGRVREVARAWVEGLGESAVAAYGSGDEPREALTQVHVWLLEGLLLGLRARRLDEIFQATLNYDRTLLRSQDNPALRSTLGHLYQSLEVCASLILAQVRALCAHNPRLPLMLSAYGRLALQFASIAGQAFYEVRSAELRQALHVSASMLETSRELNTRAASLDGVLLHLAHVVDRLMRGGSNLTFRWDGAAGSYAVRSGLGFSPVELRRLRSSSFRPEALGLVPGALEDEIVTSADGGQRALLAACGAQSCAVALMTGSDGSPLGALAVFRHNKTRFSPAELAILRGAAQNGALAMENAALLEQLGRQAQLREEAAGAARDAERLRLGRELHDSVLQELSAVKLGLETALKRGSMASLLSVIDDVVRTMHEVRRVVDDLRPGDLSAASLRDALAGYAHAIADGYDVVVHLDLPETVGIPAWATRDVYRITQEAVTNALRHAKPTTIRIQLLGDGPHTILTVRDDGTGFCRDEAVPGGGLLGMRERAAAIGASLDVMTGAGRGTTVRLTMPFGGVRVATPDPASAERSSE